MSSEDKYKKILKEAELKSESLDSALRVLQTIHQTPQTMGRAEPPPGYESALLASLRNKLPLEKAEALAPVSSPSASWISVIFAPRFAFGLSAALVLAVGVGTFFQSNRDELNQLAQGKPDYLLETVKKGDSGSMQRWLASVGDVGTSYDLDPRDPGSLVMNQDPQAAEKAISQVAKSFGMDSGI